MTNDTAGVACVATSKSGRVCGKEQIREAPFPICFEHAFLVYSTVHSAVSLKSAYRALIQINEIETPSEIAMRKAYEEQSVVYYIRIGDYIKIGFTQNLLERIKGLRVDREDVLATEPGGRAKERERHLQFAGIRIGRRENFERTADLLTHIGRIRREHGKPKMTGFVQAA